MKNRRRNNMIPNKGANKVLNSMNMMQRDNTLMRAANKANLVITCMVLHDKFGYGKVRLQRFIEKYVKQLEAYGAGYVDSVRDFETILKEECGIEIDF